MKLNDLDARLVPRLAAMLRSFLDGAAQQGARLSSAARGRGSSLLEGGGALRRLDDRFAGSGPLKLLRDVPQLGVLVVATVFLAGTGVALSLRSPESVRVRQATEQEASLPLSLGPSVGTDIDQHFAAARERVVALSRRDPDARHLALVSLNKGLTPEEVGELVGDSVLEVRRAYLRAPVPGEPEQIVFQTPGDVVAGLRQVFSQTAARKAQEQQDLLETAATIEAGTAEEEAFREVFVADARLAGQEAAAYRTACGCVFALVVEGEVRALAELPALPIVRGVEVAPRSAELSALDVRPLPPTEQGVVGPPTARRPSDGS